MEILKQIFDNNPNWASRHIVIFSLAGIMMIALNNVLSRFFGGFYGSYFGFAPSGELELHIYMVVGLSLLVYFCGYFTQILLSSDKGLDDVHLNSFMLFLKTFPLYIYWGIFMSFLIILVSFLFRHSFFGFVFMVVAILSLPWINIIPLLFCKNLGHKYEYYNPVYFIECLFLNLPKIIFLMIQTVLISIIPYSLSVMIFIVSDKIGYPISGIGLRILAMALFGYSTIMLYSAYLKSLYLDFRFPKEND